MAHRNEHLEVKTYGLKGILCDSLGHAEIFLIHLLILVSLLNFAGEVVRADGA